jgi:hypothetical protein
MMLAPLLLLVAVTRTVNLTCPEVPPCQNACVEIDYARIEAMVKELTPPTCSEVSTQDAPRSSLQPVQPVVAGGDYFLAAPGAVAAQARPQANWRPSGWRFWVFTGGSLVLGAVIEHQLDDDGDGGTSYHAHDAPEPPCWFPPGLCRGN